MAPGKQGPADDGKRNEMEMDVNSEPEAKWEGVWGRVGSRFHGDRGSADDGKRLDSLSPAMDVAC